MKKQSEKKKRFRIRRDPLDEMFSRFIRARDGWTCQRCGKYFPEGQRQGLHCSHFYGRRKQSVRFDPYNADALCFGCHQFFSENFDKHLAWKAVRLGERQFLLLEARARASGRRPDRKMIKLWLEHTLKRLEAA